MTRIELGDIEIHVLDDGTWRFPAHYFFRDVPTEAWEPLVQLGQDGKTPVGHNYAAVRTARELVVLDTGYGDDSHGGCTGHLLEELERAGYRRDDVTQVVTTHPHGDHIKRNTMLDGGARRPTFPNARYILARADWEWFGGPGRVPEFDEHVLPLAAHGMLELADPPCEPAEGIRLRPTPGHTPGHVSVIMESRGATAIFLGDVFHLPVHFAHLDWVSAFDTEPERTPRTRADICTFAIDRDALLICPHAPSPGVGRIERAGAGFVWTPVR